MNRQERKEMVADVKQALRDNLDFKLYFSTKDYHQNGWEEGEGTSIVEVYIEVYTERAERELEGIEDTWDCDVEDVIADVASEWGARYWWGDGWADGWSIGLSVHD